MNEVMKALLERRSIRKFKPDALTKEQLEIGRASCRERV